MLTINSNRLAQDRTFFSQAAALVVDLRPNIELRGQGVEQSSYHRPADFFFADTGIEMTFLQDLCQRHGLVS